MINYLLPPDDAQKLLNYLLRCPCGDVVNLVLMLNNLEKTEVEIETPAELKVD